MTANASFNGLMAQNSKMANRKWQMANGKTKQPRNYADKHGSRKRLKNVILRPSFGRRIPRMLNVIRIVHSFSGRIRVETPSNGESAADSSGMLRPSASA
jgi:hypothetical protein